MRKIFNKKVRVAVLCLLCVAILVTMPIMSVTKSSASSKSKMFVLNLWQIDSFEGGKGSRASFLQSIANDFSKSGYCYITVTTLTASAARENLKKGIVPDLISYGAGTFGIENYIKGSLPYYTWCYGSYCFLCLDENSDFSDISGNNTVINEGTENYSRVAAMMCGVESAVYERPTGAYVSLINGKYKYMLGTQRDIFRLKTRGVSFAVKPVTEFNDLYQNISVTSTDKQFVLKAEEFIRYLLKNKEKVEKLGLMVSDKRLHSDEIKYLEGLSYEYKLVTPIGANTKAEIDGAISENDLQKLKKLFK